MLDISEGDVVASYSTTHSVSMKIIGMLAEEDVPVGYGVLGSALTIARLMSPDEKLSENEEVSFVQAVMEFAGSFFVKGKGN